MIRHGVAVTLLLAASALAHDADVIYVALEPLESHLLETVTLTASTLGQLAPVDADGDRELTQHDLDARGDAIRAGVWEQMRLTSAGLPCKRGLERARLREGFVELRADFDCGSGELRQDFRILSVLPANYRVVLGSQFEGEENRAFAQGNLTAIHVPRPGSSRGFDSGRFGQSFSEGAAHDFTLDVLACFSLLLLTTRKPSWPVLLGLLSAFVPLDSQWLSALLLSVAALSVVVFRSSPKVHHLAAMFIGAALGFRAEPGPLMESVATILGAVTGLIVVGVPAVLIGRILQRRPVVLLKTQSVLMGLVIFSAAFRLAA